MEADPFENKISNESPLGIALLKHKTGDAVEVASPNGGYTIKIVKIAIIFFIYYFPFSKYVLFI